MRYQFVHQRCWRIYCIVHRADEFANSDHRLQALWRCDSRDSAAFADPPYTTLEALYYPVIAALAASDNIPEMDIYARFGSAWNSTFMNGSTTLHPNDQGYWVLGAGPTRSYST